MRGGPRLRPASQNPPRMTDDVRNWQLTFTGLQVEPYKLQTTSRGIISPVPPRLYPHLCYFLVYYVPVARKANAAVCLPFTASLGGANNGIERTRNISWAWLAAKVSGPFRPHLGFLGISWWFDQPKTPTFSKRAARPAPTNEAHHAYCCCC